MPWWTRNNLRMIQLNLREADANVDAERIVDQTAALSANVLMINAGGVAAFYPTDLPFHFRAPNQDKDLLAEVLDYAKAREMRVIARFDFSKAHESLGASHPDWFYHSQSGQMINYHGLLHTCLNGWYQQQGALEILDEVLSGYAVDGVFFNMFGYQQRDYSGTFYGECYCPNCQSRFQSMFGAVYPGTATQLAEFKDRTAHDILDQVRSRVKAHSNEVAISTYHTHAVDIERKESNTELDRAPWIYSASDNVSSLEDTWPDKLVSNCAINAVSVRHRFAAVSPDEVAIRLWQSIASGSGLDFCIIGVFDGYPDRGYAPPVQRTFAWHAKHEALYGRLQSLARIALLRPRSTNFDDYRGFFKLLKQEHVLFDVLDSALPDSARLTDYDLVIVPGLDGFEHLSSGLEAALRQGTHLLMTGAPRESPGSIRAWFDRAFGLEIGADTTADHARYLQVDARPRLPRLQNQDYLLVSGEFRHVVAHDSQGSFLPLLQSSVFGPPERSHWPDPVPGAGCWPLIEAKGRGYYLPWHPAALYANYGLLPHRGLLMDLIDDLLPEPPIIRSNAPSSVEIFCNQIPGDRYLLQLINLSGFNGTSYEPPFVMDGLTVSLTLPGHQTLKASDVETGQVLTSRQTGRQLDIQLRALADYQAVVIDTDS